MAGGGDGDGRDDGGDLDNVFFVDWTSDGDGDGDGDDDEYEYEYGSRDGGSSGGGDGGGAGGSPGAQRAAPRGGGHVLSNPNAVLTTPSMQTHLVSVQASFRRQLADREAVIRRLSKQFRQADARASEYSSQVRRLRAVNEVQERDLAASKKMFDRLVQDKQELQTRVDESDQLLKRMEWKLGANGNLRLMDKNVELTERVEALQKELARVTDDLDEARQEAQRFEGETKVLTEALAIRAQEEGQMGDMRAVLLYDVAKAKEDKAALALELSRKTDELRQCQDALDARDASVAELALIREANNRDLVAYERQVQDLQDANARLNDELAEYQMQRQVLMTYLEEQADKGPDMKDLVARLAEEQRVREESLQTEIAGYKRAIEELQRVVERHANLARIQAKTEEELSVQQAEVHRLQQQLDEVHEASKDKVQEANHLHSEIEHLTEANNRLQAQLLKEQARVAQLSGDMDQVTLRSSMAQQEVATLQAEHAQTSHSLQQQLKKCLEEKERLVDVVADAISRAEAATATQAALEQEQGRLKGHIENLTASKMALQTTLLQQVDSVRGQLDKARDLYREAEMTSARLQDENERITLLYEAERSKRRQGIGQQPTSASAAVLAARSMMAPDSDIAKKKKKKSAGGGGGLPAPRRTPQQSFTMETLFTPSGRPFQGGTLIEQARDDDPDLFFT